MTDGDEPKKKPRRSRKTPVAGTPEAAPPIAGEPGGPPERPTPTPKSRRSRKTPVAGTPQASPPIAEELADPPPVAGSPATSGGLFDWVDHQTDLAAATPAGAPEVETAGSGETSAPRPAGFDAAVATATDPQADTGAPTDTATDTADAAALLAARSEEPAAHAGTAASAPTSLAASAPETSRLDAATPDQAIGAPAGGDEPAGVQPDAADAVEPDRADAVEPDRADAVEPDRAPDAADADEPDRADRRSTASPDDRPAAVPRTDATAQPAAARDDVAARSPEPAAHAAQAASEPARLRETPARDIASAARAIGAPAAGAAEPADEDAADAASGPASRTTTSAPETSGDLAPAEAAATAEPEGARERSAGGTTEGEREPKPPARPSLFDLSTESSGSGLPIEDGSLFGPYAGDAAGDEDRRSGEDRRRRADSEPAAAVALDPTAYTDPEAATLPEPEPSTPSAHQLAAAAAAASSLDPAAAAFEAARIAGEIVGDIESASGAAIVAAAAAGAAIEAARARRAAGAPPIVADADGKRPHETTEVSATVAAAAATAAASATAASAAATTAAGPGGDVPPPTADGATDPVTTVRMQRERILRALAEDIAATPGIAAEGSLTVPVAPGARAIHPGRAASQGDELSDDDLADPVQIAAAAIQRIRLRASTDFAELRGHYHRHDIVVLLAAFLLILVAGRLHSTLVTPPTVQFPPADDPKAQRGLVFEHSQAWLKPEELQPSAPRIVRDPTGQPPQPGDAYHVALTSSVDPTARIEILIDKQPAWTNIVTGLELDRRTRWGEMYTLDDSTVEEIGDQNWLRTAYRYAHVPEQGDVPRIDRAIEYATVDREQIYVVTLFGSESDLRKVESVVAPTLRIVSKTRSALPLVPQTRSSAHRTYPNPVARAFESTVMVVVADLVDGRLQARGGGSGVIVGADGSILTNYHVVHDKNGRLHDVFVIGRFSTLDRAPQLQCAGRPNRSKLQRELDLALLKCDTDLDGRTWTPSNGGMWPTLAEVKQSTVRIGQRLWVLGYPDAGGGGLTLSEGEIGGWTGADGAAGRDFIKTDASITRGNSGGPVIDDQGKLVGIATASKTKISANGGVVETKQIGLVRPLSTAADLLAIAAIGWTPREGHTDIEIQPSAVEAPAEGVRIATHIIDAANEAPIRDALVMVLRPGVSASSVDVNRLDDQVIAWGRSNTQGEVQLKQPVPYGTYTVLVRASGYEPLIGEDKLRLDDKSPPAYDPWGGIKLLAR